MPISLYYANWKEILFLKYRSVTSYFPMFVQRNSRKWWAVFFFILSSKDKIRYGSA